MGSEAKTTLTLGRQQFAGTALLETDDLLFRGETRLRIPLKSISAVAVQDGALHVTHADGSAVFALGAPAAARWAEKIRSPRSFLDKLGVKAGMQVDVIGITDEALLADLEARQADVASGTTARAGSAMVLWRITRPSQLAKLGTLAGRIARDGAIWVVHPRGVAEVADTVIFAAASSAGLVATKVVRFSEVDTAEKLVIPRALR